MGQREEGIEDVKKQDTKTEIVVQTKRLRYQGQKEQFGKYAQRKEEKALGSTRELTQKQTERDKYWSAQKGHRKA